MIIKTHMHKTFATIAAVSFLAVMASSQPVQAQGSCCSSKSSKSGAASTADCHSDQSVVSQARDPVWVPPHGGQIHKSIWNYFEVVYGFHYPVSARGIQGQVFMRVRSNGGEFRYPLHYMGEHSGRDYLAIHVDLQHVKDGDMDTYLEIANLPNPEERIVRFTQVFAMTPSMLPAMDPMANGNERPSGLQRTPEKPPAVALADATSSDRPAIERQRTCPVTGSPLGEHGTPIKVSLGGRSLFVCCRGCIDKVLQQPDAYFQKPTLAGTPNM